MLQIFYEGRRMRQVIIFFIKKYTIIFKGKEFSQTVVMYCQTVRNLRFKKMKSNDRRQICLSRLLILILFYPFVSMWLPWCSSLERTPMLYQLILTFSIRMYVPTFVPQLTSNVCVVHDIIYTIVCSIHCCFAFHHWRNKRRWVPETQKKM